MYCTVHNDVGTVKKRYVANGTVYVSMIGTGELVCLVQFPATVDLVVTEYAVKRRLAAENGVL